MCAGGKPLPCLKTLGGKHVLITGGSRGIGLAIVKEALSLGALVTLMEDGVMTSLEWLGCIVSGS